MRADIEAEELDEAVRCRFELLTNQQRRVLELMAAGLLNKQIAHEIDVQITTVKAHVSSLLQKLGVSAGHRRSSCIRNTAALLHWRTDAIKARKRAGLIGLTSRLTAGSICNQFPDLIIAIRGDNRRRNHRAEAISDGRDHIRSDASVIEVIIDQKNIRTLTASIQGIDRGLLIGGSDNLAVPGVEQAGHAIQNILVIVDDKNAQTGDIGRTGQGIFPAASPYRWRRLAIGTSTEKLDPSSHFRANLDRDD